MEGIYSRFDKDNDFGDGEAHEESKSDRRNSKTDKQYEIHHLHILLCELRI